MWARIRIERCHTGTIDSRDLRREFVAELARRYPEQDFSADAETSELPVLDAPGAAWVVVYDGGQPIGCGGLRGLDEHTGEIKWVYVREAARGRQAGRLLLAKLEDTARELGYTRIRLSTGDRQPEALGLYHSTGYRPVDASAPTLHRLEKDLRPLPDDARNEAQDRWSRQERLAATRRLLADTGHELTADGIERMRARIAEHEARRARPDPN
ncbi:GNAT family N-acetyltransferase [Catellatospora coxensis]|uniref:N-acetyltransferase domain-containing protein n=1 Tax=Catellatospora coxensis TaxID=310354 RepID=A0A8J3KX82_9ACTN|nr:GNAT family N-acetyltransferase [Catellatospora coxensis]GIG06974.1 hypothetical protein Cco03nite_36740 [Catellatospora coxensis]